MKMIDILVRDGVGRFLAILRHRIRGSGPPTIVDLEDLESLRIPTRPHHVLLASVASRLAEGGIGSPFVLTPKTPPSVIRGLIDTELIESEEEAGFPEICDGLRRSQSLCKGNRFVTYVHWSERERVRVIVVEGSDRAISIRVETPMKWRVQMFARRLSGWRRATDDELA